MSEALVLLVLLWAALLVPSALRSRSSSPHATVGGFERAMAVLRTPSSRSGPGRELLVPGDAGRIVSRSPAEGTAGRVRHEDPVVAGRRATFTRLLAGAGVAVLLALVLGGPLWWAALGALSVTTGYASLLRRWKVQRDQARQVVRELEVPQEARAPVGAGAARAGGDAATGSVRLRRWDG